MRPKFFPRLRAAVSIACAALAMWAAQAEAAKAPEVIWAGEVLMVDGSTNGLLSVGDTKKRIADALTSRLHAEKNAGRLPFTLKEESGGYEYEGIETQVDADVPIALIPLAIMSDTLDSKFQVKEQTLYKSVVVGSLYLAVCRGGSTANNWTILGAVPVNGYDILGSDINHPLTTAPSNAMKADKYASMMERLIAGKLSFDGLKKPLSNIGKRRSEGAYEVVDVALTAKRTPEIFGGQQDKIKALIGSFYSTRFQETSKSIVYPPMTMIKASGKKSAADDVSDSIYALTGGYSASGATMTLSVPEPDHKIRLNFSGAAWQELTMKKPSTSVKNMAYKAWLRMSLDGGAEQVADDVKSVQYIVPPSGNIDELEREQLPDIYTELLIRLSDRLASGKK